MKPVNQNPINFNDCTTQTSKLHERRAWNMQKNCFCRMRITFRPHIIHNTETKAISEQWILN